MSKTVFASSFADPADVRAFRHCKALGGTDEECFKVGDNGIGCWGDDTSEGSGPSCALPPEILEEEFGTTAAARLQTVAVSRGGFYVDCLIKDRMPHLARIRTKARIDLNPDAVRALGLEPPIMDEVMYSFYPE